jgi:hypothetical protein
MRGNRVMQPSHAFPSRRAIDCCQIEVKEQIMLVQGARAGLQYLAGSKLAGRFTIWTCVVAIAILSLLPTVSAMRTGVGGHIEHVVAYAGTAFLAAAAFCAWGRVVVALLAYAGALELLQHFSPGRTPSLVDYMFSAIGVLVGVAALALLGRWLLATPKLPQAPPAT